MVVLIFVALVVVIDLYVFQGVKGAFKMAKPWVRNTIFYLYWGFATGAVVAIVLLNVLELEYIKRVIAGTLFAIYLSKALVIPFLLIDDAQRGVRVALNKITAPAKSNEIYQTEPAQTDAPYISRSVFLSQLALFIASLPMFSLIFGMIHGVYAYRVFRQNIPIANLPNELAGLKIVQLSDIHMGSLTNHQAVRRGIDMVKELEADLVLFTGDLVNNHAEELGELTKDFATIKAPLGVYSVLGNHDYGDYSQWPSAKAKAQNFYKIKHAHSQMGWKLLQNQHQVIHYKGKKIAILGVENWGSMARFPKLGDINKAKDGLGHADVKILMTHDPSHWDHDVVPNHTDIDLTLSGHTHGMQFGVEVPGYIKWSPVQYVYKKWAGLYTIGKQHLYVNRGFGFIGYPGRVGIMPEISVHTLVKA